MGEVPPKRSQRTAMVAVSAFAALVGACFCLSPLACFVGVDRTVTVRPGGEVTVRSAAGEDLPGATVTVYRFSHPHDMPGGEWVATTDARGVVTFDATQEEQTVRPLMMHGVPEYYWRVCAEAEGHGAAQREWPWADVDTAPASLVLEFPAEADTRSCADLVLLP